MKSKTGARAIGVAELKAAVLEARKAGKTFREIEAELGVSKSRAQELAAEAVTEVVRTSVEALRAVEDKKCDRDEAALEPKILRGDTRAVTARIRVATHRAKLNGIFAPVRGEVIVVPSPPPSSGKYDYTKLTPAELMALRVLLATSAGQRPTAEQARTAAQRWRDELEAPEVRQLEAHDDDDHRSRNPLSPSPPDENPAT